MTRKWVIGCHRGFLKEASTYSSVECTMKFEEAHRFLTFNEALDEEKKVKRYWGDAMIIPIEE